MFIPDTDAEPGYNHSNKRVGGKNLTYLFCSHKYHKIENYFIFNWMSREPRKEKTNARQVPLPR
jgi:hypothetical protein